MNIVNSPKHLAELLLIRYSLKETLCIADVINWSTSQLWEGKDSPHLRYLAGYSEAEAYQNCKQFKVDFLKALNELGIEIPQKEAAWNHYACLLCKMALEGTLSCQNAHKMLYGIWQKTLFSEAIEMDNRFEVWMYLDDSLALVKDGYSPVLDKFQGLNSETYEDFFKKEAMEFLQKYCQ